MTNYGITIYLDTSGDIEFNDLHQIRMTATDAEKVKQDLRVLCKTILSEDIFAPTFGFDLITIKAHNYNEELIKTAIKNTLMQYQYLKSVESIEVSSPDVNRNMNAEIHLTTTKDLSLAIGVAI